MLHILAIALALLHCMQQVQAVSPEWPMKYGPLSSGSALSHNGPTSASRVAVSGSTTLVAANTWFTSFAIGSGFIFLGTTAPYCVVLQATDLAYVTSFSRSTVSCSSAVITDDGAKVVFAWKDGHVRVYSIPSFTLLASRDLGVNIDSSSVSVQWWLTTTPSTKAYSVCLLSEYGVPHMLPITSNGIGDTVGTTTAAEYIIAGISVVVSGSNIISMVYSASAYYVLKHDSNGAYSSTLYTSSGWEYDFGAAMQVPWPTRIVPLRSSTSYVDWEFESFVFGTHDCKLVRFSVLGVSSTATLSPSCLSGQSGRLTDPAYNPTYNSIYIARVWQGYISYLALSNSFSVAGTVTAAASGGFRSLITDRSGNVFAAGQDGVLYCYTAILSFLWSQTGLPSVVQLAIASDNALYVANVGGSQNQGSLKMLTEVSVTPTVSLTPAQSPSVTSSKSLTASSSNTPTMSPSPSGTKTTSPSLTSSVTTSPSLTSTATASLSHGTSSSNTASVTTAPTDSATSSTTPSPTPTHSQSTSAAESPSPSQVRQAAGQRSVVRMVTSCSCSRHRFQVVRGKAPVRQ